MDQLIQSLTCCSDRQAAANKLQQSSHSTLLITCFDVADKEITDLSVPANTSWSEMQDMITGGERLTPFTQRPVPFLPCVSLPVGQRPHAARSRDRA